MAKIAKQFSFNLDIKKTPILSPIPMTCGDSGNEFVISVYNGASTVCLTGCTVRLVISGKGGVSVLSNGSDANVSISASSPYNVLTITIPSSAISAGQNCCELKIFSSDTDGNEFLVSSSRFSFIGLPSLADGDANTNDERIDLLQYYLNALAGINMQVTSLPNGSTATGEAEYSSDGDLVLSFGLVQGDKGDKGDTGEQGIRGLKGDRGVKGDKGDKGDTGTPSGFGTPTATANTLAAGESATAAVVASGDATAKIFAFTFGVPQGLTGYSAYDQAVTGGYTDTEAAFLADLAAIEGLAAELEALL